MDWMNRGTRPGAQGHPGAAGSSSTPAAQTTKKIGLNRGMRWATVGLLFAGTILILALLAYMVVGSKGQAQGQYVDQSKMQAVFLNGGQVYFGKIKSLNDKALRMSDIYYLRVNQQVQPNGQQSSSNNDISLVKLGCELHGPQDQMVINQNQVIFWENLKDDGQVAKAVAEYVKQNPNGQKCDATSASDTSAQNSTQTQSNTTNTTNSTTPKKQ
jgi:hypothetical protein